MSMFKNLGSEGLEEAQDYIGGGGAVDSDIYVSTIKVAFMRTSAKGSIGVELHADLGGRDYRETFWMTNQKGENFFTREGKKVPLAGFTTMNNICLIVTGKSLQDQEGSTEEKMVNVWDPEQKKEMPKSVPVLTELTGQPIALGILKVLENKSEKQGDEYAPTAEERTINSVDIVFHPEEKFTVWEATQGKEAPEAWDNWLKRNKGQVRDRRKIKDGQVQNGKSGRPGASKAPSAPPQAGGAAPARKSLFGKK